jgi:hypothetical protein
MATNEERSEVPPTPSGEHHLVAIVAPKPRKLSEELQRLIEEFHTRSVTLRELIGVLQARAYDLLMLLLALPFLVPVPLPGLSMALGLVIAIIAVRLTLGQRPWLPQRLLDTQLPPRFFPLLLGSARRILRAFEVLLKPRMSWLTTPPLPQMHALIIACAAVILLLPLPPGTNFPPAVVIVLIAGGLLERDGAFILAGYVAFALNIVFFSLLAIYGTKLFHVGWHWITGG